MTSYSGIVRFIRKTKRKIEALQHKLHFLETEKDKAYIETKEYQKKYRDDNKWNVLVIVKIAGVRLKNIL